MPLSQLSILSWNIRQGGGSRISKVVGFIQDSGAEIVQLSEYRNNKSGILLRSHLLRAGYRFQFVTPADANENSVLVASKIPAGQVLFDSNFEHRHKFIHVDFGIFQLLGLYMPHKKPHRLFELVVQQVEQSAQPCIVVGDLNTGKNYKDQKGDSFWYTEDFDQLLKAGFEDAFRYFWPNKMEYSWYSHQGNGFRYDHVLIDRRLLPILHECYYLHEGREKGLSDHSAMVLRLKA